jgi:hypothetical protein
MKHHEQSSGDTPVIYAAGDKHLIEFLGCLLGEKGQSCRTFTGAHALFALFASARPRPFVLIFDLERLVETIEGLLAGRLQARPAAS